ncbi:MULTISPECIES: hypothetical protein [Corallococcus]|nr:MULTISPECIES: hypothetical protein [Corallococcus]
MGRSRCVGIFEVQQVTHPRAQAAAEATSAGCLGALSMMPSRP